MGFFSAFNPLLRLQLLRLWTLPGTMLCSLPTHHTCQVKLLGGQVHA